MTFNQSVDKIRAISQASTEMLDFLVVIESMAQQTSLLSMNAAIEAAHAGDEGKQYAEVFSPHG